MESKETGPFGYINIGGNIYKSKDCKGDYYILNPKSGRFYFFGGIVDPKVLRDMADELEEYREQERIKKEEKQKILDRLTLEEKIILGIRG